MTKRKWRAPAPEELERLSDWCFRYGLPDGGRVVIHGDGRAFAREKLTEVLSSWERIWCYGTEDGTQAVLRGVFPREREIVPRFNLPALKRELPVKHFALINALYDALKEQALVASYAVGVAEVEIGLKATRVAAGKKGGAVRRSKAATREDNLKAVAKTILAQNPSLSRSKSRMATTLSERYNLGGAHSIRRKLPRLLRK